MPKISQQPSSNINQQSQWATNLRQRRNQTRQQKSKNLPLNLQQRAKEEKGQQELQTTKPADVRRRLQQARRLRRAESKIKEEGGVITKAKQKAATALTAKLLSSSWTSLVESFGLTLIYINFHFFMVHIFKSKYFCPFGTEWFPPAPTKTATKIKNTLAGGAIGIGEILLMFLLDVLILVIIAAIIYIIYQQFKWKIEAVETMLKLWNKIKLI